MSRPKPHRRPLRFVRRPWFRLWSLTVALSLALAGVIVITGNHMLEPAAFFYGAAAGPLAVLVATRDRTGIFRSVPRTMLLTAFFFGSGLAVLVAGYLEAKLIGGLDTVSMILVGLIEEPAKLALPVALVLFGRGLSRASGLALALASATGFAILETMAYGYSQLAEDDRIFAAEQVLLVRGLAAPFGHVVWTGIAAAVIFGEWERHGQVVVNRTVVAGLGAAAVLHSAFDMVLNPHVPALVHLLLPMVAMVGLDGFLRVTRDLEAPYQAPRQAPRPAPREGPRDGRVREPVGG